MSISLSIAEEYFKKNKVHTLNDFLNYSYEIMFTAYLVKTIRMTRIHYFSPHKKIYSVPTLPDFFADSETLSHIDTYECDFYDLIKVLTQKQQTFIIMHFKFGYCENVVAEKLGITPQAAHGLKLRAFNALRKELCNEYKKQ